MGVLEQALEIVFAGLPVFPCGKNKRPVISKDEGGHGFLDATKDEDAVRLLFRRAANGARLVGVPTGATTGFDILDIDPRHGGDRWEMENAHRLPETRIHGTLNGGRHYLFRHAPGVRNSASKQEIAPGVDVRGDGGYVIYPPSLGYQIVSDAEMVDWPDWLLELVLKRDPTKDRPEISYRSVEISSKRLDGLTRSILGRVSHAGEGAKHYALRNAALSLGGIQQIAGLSDDQAIGMLMQALPGSVKNWPAAKETARWGLEHGRARPLELEDRPEYAPKNGAAHPTVAPAISLPPEEKAGPGLPLVWFSDIEPVLETHDFVQGVLMSGTSIVVYGASNSGKTFWVTDLCLHVCAAIRWNDRRVEMGGIVYCALEGTIGFRNRVAAWKTARGLEAHDLPFVAIPAGLNLRDPEADLDSLIAAVKIAGARMALPVRLIVIDTLSRALAGGNENSPEDMGALVTCMDKLRHATGSAVLFVHHSGKDQAKGARGHTLLTAAIDTEIEVVVDEGGGGSTATVVKQREMRKGDAFSFTLKVVELGVNQHGEPVTTCVVDHGGDHTAGAVPGRRRLTGHNKRALEILADLVATSGKEGDSGVPVGCLSVPEKWWRDRFFDRAMPGAEDEAKRKGFRRAADLLIEARFVGMANRRVWLPSHKDRRPDNE